MQPGLIPLTHFWHPRHWLTWLGLGMLRLLVMLPQRARMATGRWLGRRACALLDSRRKIVATNIGLCFPELDAAEQAQRVREHFESLGMGVIELGMAWWCSAAELAALTQIDGFEHVQAGLARERGVLVHSGHFAAIEVSGVVIAPLVPPMAAMYRPSKNTLNDQIMRRCRGRSVPQLIAKTGIKQLLRVLRQNRMVWYAADQAYNRKGTVVVPFFGEPATTNTSVSQIARVSKAAIVPFHSMRLPDASGYRIRFWPALEDFPSGDEAADAERLNQLLEEQIRLAPAQYYWVHRRFKGRPAPYPDPYKQPG
ncbi:MAG: lipid A biosynthesis lauroyl acyltransferase [Gammaproteobacteria bacterium]|jgi:KDO2-lipid IV(A) lauroyltransferase|nr:lipid A biosynthesis lauroyl acyltransferase [Gammaproteobacteria bacterium]